MHSTLSMNLPYFPHRFRATADWVSRPSAVALNLWGSPRSGVQCAKICLGEFSPRPQIRGQRSEVRDQKRRAGCSTADFRPLTSDLWPERGNANSIVSGALYLLGLLWMAGSAIAGPSFTASLDRNVVPAGETVTLSLVFEGVSPPTSPSLPALPN